MVDIFCKEKGIKAAWIPKLLDSKNKCNIIINNYLAKQGLNFKLLLKMNFRQDIRMSLLVDIFSTLLKKLTFLQGLKFITILLKLLNYSPLYYEIKNLKNRM